MDLFLKFDGMTPFPILVLSAFRTRGVPGPTSKFVAACPCPDGLARDGTQVEE
jgi:hypothetical protein